MTVTAPVPVAALAELATLAALHLPAAGSGPNPATRATDQVALAPSPTMQALWQLALSGSQQLGVLLPMLEQTIHDFAADPFPATLGHLARATGDAAHWIDTGSAGLLARPGSAEVDAWRQAAKTSLHDASDLLVRAEQHLDLAQHPEMLWAMTQVVGAQRHVVAALDNLSALCAPLPIGDITSSRRRFDLLGAVAVIGMALLLLVCGFAYGMWLLMATLVAVSVVLAWSSRGVRLELRSTSPPPSKPKPPT